jgi:hypothetical protein
MKRTAAGRFSNDVGADEALPKRVDGNPKRWGYPGKRPSVVRDDRVMAVAKK